MTIRQAGGCLALTIALVCAASAQSGVQGDKQFQSALQKEMVDGDLKAAIAEYRRVSTRPGVGRELAATALMRIGECYQKLGDPQARAVYEQILRDFSDQKELAVLARTRVGGTGRAQREGEIVLKRVWRGSTSGTVSRDGRYLSAEDGTGNLALHDIAAGTDRPLTSRSDYSLGGSAISRDGSQVAYESYRGCAVEKERSALCVVAIDGNTVPPSRTLFESDDVSEITPMDWAPDGKSIAVRLRRQDRTAQIGLISVPGGSLRVLKTVDWRGPTRIFFSPNGHDLAFDLPASETSAQRDVFVLAADGSRGVLAVEHPRQDVVMGWTPDGKRLLFASDRSGSMGLWAVGFADGKPQGTPDLVKGTIGSAWSMGVTSAGALHLGVRVSDRDISVTTIDPASGKLITPPTRPIQTFIGFNTHPAWSPDGKSFAYVSSRGFNPTNNTERIIAIRSVDTGDVHELLPRLLYFNQISWAPDSRSLVTGGTDLKGRSGVFRIDAQTGEAVAIVGGTILAYPKWSPDGKRLYYRSPISSGSAQDSVPDAQASILEHDLASGREREVTRGELGTFSVSPDGRWIAATRGGVLSGRATAVVLIPVEGGETRELFRAAKSESFTLWTGLPWTPDGRGIIVRKLLPAGVGELWLVPTTGAPPRKLDVDASGWSTGPVGVISLHPDGRQLAFTSGSISDEVWVLQDFLPPPTAR